MTPPAPITHPVFYCPTCNQHMQLPRIEWDTWRGPGPAHRIHGIGLARDHFHLVYKVQELNEADPQQFFFLRHLDQDVKRLDRLAQIRRMQGKDRLLYSL